MLFVRNYRGAFHACSCAGSSLEALFLNLNNLTGTIPSAIQASSPLEALALGGNALTGALLACTPPLCCINQQAGCWLQGVPSDSWRACRVHFSHTGKCSRARDAVTGEQPADRHHPGWSGSPASAAVAQAVQQQPQRVCRCNVLLCPSAQAIVSLHCLNCCCGGRTAWTLPVQMCKMNCRIASEEILQ